MKQVRIYYAGVPAKNSKPEKIQVLKNFHLGVGQGGNSIEVQGPVWEPSDLAVMQGWVHQRSANVPHLDFRKKIIQEQKRIGKHTLAIDSNLFLYKDTTNPHKYLRFSLDDVFPDTGCYFTDNVIPERWEQIKKDIGIELKPWKSGGKHILICLQRNGGWSMGLQDVMVWLERTIKQIRFHTGRKIIVRGHPGDRRTKQYLKLNLPGVYTSKNENILDDFEQAHCVVTFNSSPGVAAAIEGVPVFVTDPNKRKSQAFEVANFDLAAIENPQTFDREKWIQKIAMSHFCFKDLVDGTAWNIIKDYL